jgi:SNF2 family DNA or RNA helicase
MSLLRTLPLHAISSFPFQLLPKLFAGGHKVLIFSQMVRVLDLLEDLIKIQKYKYERLDGSTTASARSAAVDRFHRKSCQRFVMLLSTRAGGLGLNLVSWRPGTVRKGYRS